MAFVVFFLFFLRVIEVGYNSLPVCVTNLNHYHCEIIRILHDESYSEIEQYIAV